MRNIMYIADGKREILCGHRDEFVERRGCSKSSYRVGRQYCVKLNAEERACLRKICGSEEFVVEVVAIEVRGEDLVVKVKRVTEMPADVEPDMFVKWRWI